METSWMSFRFIQITIFYFVQFLMADEIILTILEQKASRVV